MHNLNSTVVFILTLPTHIFSGFETYTLFSNFNSWDSQVLTFNASILNMTHELYYHCINLCFCLSSSSGTIDINEFAALWKYIEDWKACFDR